MTGIQVLATKSNYIGSIGPREANTDYLFPFPEKHSNSFGHTSFSPESDDMQSTVCCFLWC